LRHEDGRVATVPIHRTTMKVGTLAALLEQARVSVADFREVL